MKKTINSFARNAIIIAMIALLIATGLFLSREITPPSQEVVKEIKHPHKN